MRRAPFLAPALALALVLAMAVPVAAAPPGAGSSVPISSVLDYPQSKMSGGNFTLHSRLLRGSADGWCCRLYFDTDLNSMTGWFPSRGFEYVACPNLTQRSNPVMHTVIGSRDGLGGDCCGQGAVQIDRNSLDLTVPLSVLGSNDGRFAWELMVFDSQGNWLGSYGGRFD